jgi:imidazolonepropionase-like amidohydrolase
MTSMVYISYLLASVLVFMTAPANEPVIAFTNVTVVTMNGDELLAGYTVLIDGDRIITVGPGNEITIPDGAERIDGTGKYLMPGLAEMHGHIPPPSSSAIEVENVLFLYVANGITTVRGMLGYPGQLDLRRRALSGELLSPTLYLAGPSFNGGSISSPEQAAQRVRDQKNEGWDLLKVHPGLTLAEYDAMAIAAQEAEIDFGGHVPAEVGIEHAIEMGQRTFDHLDGYGEFLNGSAGPVDRGDLKSIVRKTREANAWVVPTMVLWETILGVGDLHDMLRWPELKYVPAQTVSSWERAFRSRTSGGVDLNASYSLADARMEILAALNDEGVGVLMGTDAPQQFSVPGFSLHREMDKMVESGMSTLDVLQSGTVNVGRYFDDKDFFGTVAAGQRADLILLDENPLTSVQNVSKRSGVMVRGRWISESEIQERLAGIAASYKRQ